MRGHLAATDGTVMSGVFIQKTAAVSLLIVVVACSVCDLLIMHTYNFANTHGVNMVAAEPERIADQQPLLFIFNRTKIQQMKLTELSYSVLRCK